jgi:hypothetical protein
MVSGANALNPYQKRIIVKEQIHSELFDRKMPEGHRPIDCFRSFLSVRTEIIENYLKTLDESLEEDEIFSLAKCTRGKKKEDIEVSVATYLNTRIMPPCPDHPTNTCDPHNGNWCERLMDPYHLQEILKKLGFESNVLGGYWGAVNNAPKRWLGALLNYFVFLLGKQGLRFAQTYGIYAQRR